MYFQRKRQSRRLKPKLSGSVRSFNRTIKSGAGSRRRDEVVEGISVRSLRKFARRLPRCELSFRQQPGKQVRIYFHQEIDHLTLNSE